MGGAAHATTEAEILALAKDADDPRDRGFLVLLLKMHKSLDANTRATEQIAAEFVEHRKQFHEHREEFSQHVDDERALFNQGRGAWKILATVLTVAQVAAFSILTWYVRADDKRQDTIEAISQSLIKSDSAHVSMDQATQMLMQRVDRLEKKVFDK